MIKFLKETEELFYKLNIKLSVNSHIELIKSKSNEEYNKIFNNYKDHPYFFETLYQTYNITKSGEFYTPLTLIKFLKEYIGDISDKNIIDYAAGVGTLLNPLDAKSKTCIELNKESSEISSLRNLNSINDNAFNHKEKYDIAIINPPYGLKEYTEYDFIHHSLKYCDRVVAILPLGVLFADKFKKDRKQLLESIKTIIVLPPKTFDTTDIPVCLIDIDKINNSNKVKMINLQDNFIKIGRRNELDKDCYKYLNILENGSSEYVDLETLVENDYNFSVTRYVYKEEVRDHIDIDALNHEISDLYKDIIATNKSVLDMLKG